MTLSELANIAEILGGLAVLVSLVYLTLELRRNTRTARSAAAWNATVALSELTEGISHDRELSALMIRAADATTRPEDLTVEEYSQYFFVFRSIIFKTEAQWYLWREGTLTDEMWQNRRTWSKNFVSGPVAASVWAFEKELNQYSTGFIESIDSAIATRKVPRLPV